MFLSGWWELCRSLFLNLPTRRAARYLTDQTSAHDPLNGYVPNGMTLPEGLELRQRDPKAYQERSLDAMARHVEGMLRLQKMGAVTFDYGNNIRTFAFQRGVKNAYDFPGFVPPTFVHCSAKDADRSAGWRCQAIRPISR